jgi:hypothetical protein
MTEIQIPAEIHPDTLLANVENAGTTEAEALAWKRLACAVKAIKRGDMAMAAAHLADSFAANPHILEEITSR